MPSFCQLCSTGPWVNFDQETEFLECLACRALVECVSLLCQDQHLAFNSFLWWPEL